MARTCCRTNAGPQAPRCTLVEGSLVAGRRPINAPASVPPVSTVPTAVQQESTGRTRRMSVSASRASTALHVLSFLLYRPRRATHRLSLFLSLPLSPSRAPLYCTLCICYICCVRSTEQMLWPLLGDPLLHIRALTHAHNRGTLARSHAPV